MHTHAKHSKYKGKANFHISTNLWEKKKNTELSILNKRCSRSNLLRYFSYRIEWNIQHLQLRQPTNQKQTTMENPATDFQTENSLTSKTKSLQKNSLSYSSWKLRETVVAEIQHSEKRQISQIFLHRSNAIVSQNKLLKLHSL